MKEVPKKQQDEVSGSGITGVTVVPVPTWPMPTFPTEPCTPIIDPLGDTIKNQPK